MKKFLLFFVMLISSIVGFAQSDESEKAKPMLDTEIVRKCLKFDIEGDEYEDVVVTMKSNNPDNILTGSKVKVTVVNASGTKVWAKTLKNVYLYVFSTGEILVGKPHFDQLAIFREGSKNWTGIVREKEGVY